MVILLLYFLIMRMETGMSFEVAVSVYQSPCTRRLNLHCHSVLLSNLCSLRVRNPFSYTCKQNWTVFLKMLVHFQITKFYD
jgi:hypothetical protein